MNKPVSKADIAIAQPALGGTAAALAAAGNLSARIRARAAQTEEDRRVPDSTIEELAANGLFGIVMPKVFGGSELGFAALVRSTIEIAAACGSTGWVYGVLAGHSWLLNLFPVEAQSEIHLSPNPRAATVFRLGGTTTKVEGGYRLTGGEGRFCSGVDHSSWVVVGNAVQRDGLPPEPRFFVLPRADIEVIDDWYTAGMRGTGSKTIRIANAFIPEHRSVSLAEMVAGTSPGAAYHPGAIYRMPFADIAPFSIVGAPLGMALGAVRGFGRHLANKMKSSTDLDLAESSTTLARVAAAAAEVDAAIALVVADAEMIDAAEDPSDLTDLDRAKIPRDWAYAVQTARHAVNQIFEVAGGSGIYDSSEIQRSWRDANSAAQHFAFTWDNAMTNYGRTLVGRTPLAYQLKKR